MHANRRIATMILVGGLLMQPVAATAAHDAKRMEMDGNATNGGASGTDWGPVMPGGAEDDVTAVFVEDAEPADTSYFTGGGSKDTNDVTEWATTTGDVAPDKNEITDAYAIAYRSKVDTGRTDVGDLLFYFGADRFANDGDAQMGFWFFRNAVGISGSSFTGKHAVGDILVLAHFTNGGRVSTAEVFRWVGSGGSHGELDLLASGNECAGSLKDEKVCSVANESAVKAPWAYTPKQGASGTFPANSFYEGALNISRLVPGVECFSSMLAETRSSASTDAQLKDLALGPFDTCPPKPKPRTRTVAAAPPAVPAPKPAVKSAPKEPVGKVWTEEPLAASGPESVPELTLMALGLLGAGWAMRVRADGLRLSHATVPGAPRRPAPSQQVPYWIEQDRHRRRLR